MAGLLGMFLARKGDDMFRDSITKKKVSSVGRGKAVWDMRRSDF